MSTLRSNPWVVFAEAKLDLFFGFLISTTIWWGLSKDWLESLMVTLLFTFVSLIRKQGTANVFILFERMWLKWKGHKVEPFNWKAFCQVWTLNTCYAAVAIWCYINIEL